MLNNPNLEELKKQAIVADKEDRERGEILQSFVKHPGWALFLALVEKNMQAAADMLMQPEQTLERDGMNSEYLKGTMRGLIIARDIPSATIAGMKDIRTSDVEETAQ